MIWNMQYNIHDSIDTISETLHTGERERVDIIMM